MVGATDDSLGTAPTVATRRSKAQRSGHGLQIGLGALVLVAAAGAGVLAFKPLTESPGSSAPVATMAVTVPPPWAREVPADRRDAAKAAALVQDGDNLYLAGERALARSKYLEAFEAEPSAALALKLGMLARLRGPEGEAEARGFFARALKESPASPARAVIREWYPDVEQPLSTR
jgi:hypothetical protein